MPIAPCVVGLIGHPVAHSRSPAMQQAAFDALGISARYELWDTLPDDLPARVDSLRQPGALGANVTIPYKSAVLPLLDTVDEHARRIGAVNTIVCQKLTEGVRLVGYNTDREGVGRVLKHFDPGANCHRAVLILGSGGAALAAVAGALYDYGRVWVAARRPEGAADMLRGYWQRRLGDKASPTLWLDHALDLNDESTLAKRLSNTSTLINATPVGMNDPDAAPLDLELLRQLPSGAFVFDMIYAPPETALVRAARALGLRASGGMPMLLHQGAAAFTLWTGRPAPLGAMRAALGLGA